MTTFKRNLVAGYCFSLLLLVVSSVASYISINSLLDNAGLVNHTNQVTSELESILSTMKDAETGQRGFLLTGNENFLEPYVGAEQRARATLDRVRILVADNPAQLDGISILDTIVSARSNILRKLIAEKRKGTIIVEADMMDGKHMMDEARRLVKKMQDRENALLISRTAAMKDSAAATPIIIIIAGVLAIIITLVSFIRLSQDFEKREDLQKQLLKKDIEINRRIAAIQNIADRIALGDYKIRVDDAVEDVLGELAVSLNKMADSLDTSFEQLSQKEWLQSGIATLSNELIGENDVITVGERSVTLLAEYTESNAGAFYIAGNDGRFYLQNKYALSPNNKNTVLALHEGLVGQSAAAGKTLEVTNLPQDGYSISYTAADVKPKAIIAIPVIFDGSVKAVMEFASVKCYTPNAKELFETVALDIGIAINTAQAKHKLEELLAETQAQAEELQAQHTELEAQSEKLQASEEELRVQQEELRQTNEELEERSRLLEEKNEEIVESNLEIQNKAEALEKTTRYKSEFLANMSHELRTPLNSILLLSRLLSENPDKTLSNDQVEYAKVILGSGNGLLLLIDEILDLSKIESGKMELEYKNVSITDILREVDALFKPVATEKNIGFKINAVLGIPERLETDQLRLTQVLRNLISNALKFTQHGSVTLEIAKKGNNLNFAVIDTGIGIAKDQQSAIFEAFRQADGSTRRKYGGTGLGLSISKELAKLLGGEITLSSEPGKGSIFVLTVPIAKSTAADMTKALPEKTLQTIDEEDPTDLYPTTENYISLAIPNPIADDRDTIKPGEKAILIIEDDIAFATSLLTLTRKKGYKGLVAVRGDEGVELATKHNPIGILLDIQLPVKSGWQVMAELKGNAATRPIPIHVMSSHNVRNKSISQGAIDFINKPVAFEKIGEMFEKIESALSREPKKVLIIEENPQHAKALAYFLDNYHVNTEIKKTLTDSINALNRNEVDCVILDMDIPSSQVYQILEDAKKTEGMENLPIIIFTGKNLTQQEEMKIKRYADSIVLKTAHSYQRILDEVSLFLHVVNEKKEDQPGPVSKSNGMGEVLKNKTVLIADDDVRNIFSLTKTLEKYGMHIITAIDGSEALKQLDANAKVDVVLMDMMMPEMDGYESIKRIRAISKYRNLPIIAVTAKAMNSDREKCISAGASDYITKPVDVDQLVSLLRVWLYENA